MMEQVCLELENEVEDRIQDWLYFFVLRKVGKEGSLGSYHDKANKEQRDQLK